MTSIVLTVLFSGLIVLTIWMRWGKVFIKKKTPTPVIPSTPASTSTPPAPTKKAWLKKHAKTILWVAVTIAVLWWIGPHAAEWSGGDLSKVVTLGLIVFIAWSLFVTGEFWGMVYVVLIVLITRSCLGI